MADNFLPEEAVWEVGVRQVETTDTVLGGPGGTPNIAPNQLANRTLYLKQQIEKRQNELIGLILPDSTALASRENAFLADGSSYLVSDYPKLMSKVQGTAIMVAQSLIDASPEQYAACYGISDNGENFTVPNYTLRPHLAAAGLFGAVGTTIDDQIELHSHATPVLSTGSNGVNIANQSDSLLWGSVPVGSVKFSTYPGTQANTTATSTLTSSDVYSKSGYTEVNSSFLHFYIIHGEVA